MLRLPLLIAAFLLALIGDGEDLKSKHGMEHAGGDDDGHNDGDGDDDDDHDEDNDDNGDKCRYSHGDDDDDPDAHEMHFDDDVDAREGVDEESHMCWKKSCR